MLDIDFLLAYAGFLRFDEFHKLRPNDLTIDCEMCSLKSGKQDVST